MLFQRLDRRDRLGSAAPTCSMAPNGADREKHDAMPDTTKQQRYGHDVFRPSHGGIPGNIFRHRLVRVESQLPIALRARFGLG